MFLTTFYYLVEQTLNVKRSFALFLGVSREGLKVSPLMVHNRIDMARHNGNMFIQGNNGKIFFCQLESLCSSPQCAVDRHQLDNPIARESLAYITHQPLLCLSTIPVHGAKCAT